jgi:hypothetical protein
LQLIENALVRVSVPKEKIHLVLRDAANVMKTTTRKLELELELDSFDCFLHKIQLAIGDGMSVTKIGEVLKDARALVTHFNSSQPFRDVFKEWQQHFGLKQTVLIRVSLLLEKIYE